ncbi:MAG TPA: hypothetical protein VJT49_24160 [Amycolatopsis sp.]|uniref:hypothetical protein n=1 Tax=Amycolatopsis sp. TaxID=37632 RepID=UPI002B48632D|nr:hypothetical protein [Amycolatopsis sp.]HKS48146.1 hypothetical protein [Amycolatopsis sp.]
MRGEWALIPGHPANTATSPLYVALLGFVTFLTRISGSAHPVFALGVVYVLAGAVFGWGWARLRLPVSRGAWPPGQAHGSPLSGSCWCC